MHYNYKTSGTCATVISFDIDGDIIRNVKFTGGCNGNLKALSALVDGMKVEDIEGKLKGITCGWKEYKLFRPTFKSGARSVRRREKGRIEKWKDTRGKQW